jgi:hypothetical protein
MQIPLTLALSQLRDELREAVLESKGKDVVFTPKEIEFELAVTFDVKEEARGGIKILALLDLSAGTSNASQFSHRVKFKMDVANDRGEPLKVRSTKSTSGL